jgi:hypothetical protein
MNRVFLDVTAQHIDAGDAFHAAQLRRNDPILDRSKIGRLFQRGGKRFAFRGCVARPFLGQARLELDRPDVDFSEPRHHRPHARRHPFRQGLPRRLQPLVHQVAREIDVRGVGEDRCDLREAVARQRARLRQARQPGERRFQRERDLPLNLLGPERGGDRVDLHLSVGDVRHRVDRQSHQLADAEARQDQDNQQNQPAAADG